MIFKIKVHHSMALSTIDRERYVPSCTTNEEDDLNSWRRCWRSQIEPTGDHSSVNNSDSILPHLQSPRASIQVWSNWCPADGSPDDLSEICTRGIKLSCRYWISFAELELRESPLPNLRINNGGVVVHVRWHSPTSIGFVGKTLKWNKSPRGHTESGGRGGAGWKILRTWKDDSLSCTHKH